MIVRWRVAPNTDITWAVPLSGYGHIADEQPLPYIHRGGEELTPRFSGEPDQEGCGPDSVGLPFGTLARPWPWCQRLFNLPRRNVNLYWRNLFQSRNRPDRHFAFLEQLDYAPLPNGFRGDCPLVEFQRLIELGPQSIAVTDTLHFRRSVLFEVFHPVVVPLFPDWVVNGVGLRSLICQGFDLKPAGRQRSSAGQAILWTERQEKAGYSAEDRVVRRYMYRWEPA